MVKRSEKRYILIVLPLITLVGGAGIFVGDMNYAFSLVWFALLFISPFVTAPLVAGEYDGGTDALLLSLPLSDNALALGLLRRSLRVLMTSLLPTIVLFGLLLAFRKYDTGQYIASLFGLGLGTLYLAAGGLFLSSCFNRTVTAWLATLLFQAPLFLIPRLLSLRLSRFFLGFLSWESVGILAGLSLLFASLASHVLTRRRGGRAGRGGILVLTVFTLLCYQLPGGLDMTETGTYRLNRVTKRRLGRLEAPLYLTWYHSPNLTEWSPSSEGLTYLSHGLVSHGKIRFEERLLTMDDPLLDEARRRGWAEQSLSRPDGSFEPVYSAWEIEYGGRRETLSFVYDPLLAEEQLLAALQRFMGEAVPRVGIVRGREGRTLDEYGALITGAAGEYYTYTDLTDGLDTLLQSPPDVLLLLDSTDLTRREAGIIMAYVKGGGALLAALSSLEIDPVNRDTILKPPPTAMHDELAILGITLGDSFLVDPSRALYLDGGDGGAPLEYPLWFNTDGNSLFDYQALWAVPIFYTADDPPLWRIKTSRDAYTAGSLGDISPPALESLPPGLPNRYTTALAMNVGEGTMIVLSGAESLSPFALMNGGYNGAWIQSLLFFLSGNEEMVELREKQNGAVQP